MANGQMATFSGGLGLSARSAQLRDDPGGHRHRLSDPRVLHRLHGARQRLLPLLRLPESVRVLHADAGAGEQLRAAVRRLGRRGPVQLPADRLLLPQEIGRRRGQESVHRQPRGRRRVHHRHAADAEHRSARCGSPTSMPLLHSGSFTPRRGLRHAQRHRACCCSSAPPANRRSSRCTSGCPTRWKAPRRSPP